MEDYPIHERIRFYRNQKRFSQEAIAFDLNISQAAYSRIELGETELTTSRLYEIADILEVSVHDLLPKSKYGVAINFFGVRTFLNGIISFFPRIRTRIFAS